MAPFHPRRVREKDVHEHAEQLSPRSVHCRAGCGYSYCCIAPTCNGSQYGGPARCKRDPAAAAPAITKSWMSRGQPHQQLLRSFWQQCFQERLACTISKAKVLQISRYNHVTDEFQRVFAFDCRYHWEPRDPISDLTTDGNWRDCRNI